MKKLIIITIACALTAQAQAGDYSRRELRRDLDEIADQNDEIIKQNERIEQQMQSDQTQRRLESYRIEKQNRDTEIRNGIAERERQSERITRQVSEMSDAELEANARAAGLKPDTARFGPVVVEKPASTPAPEIKPLILPSNILDDYEVLEKLPAGSVIHAPQGDVIVK